MRKQIVTDVLFFLQVGCVMIFAIPQFRYMLTSNKGVSITWYSFGEAFATMLFLIAFSDHRAQPSRNTRQRLTMYSLWIAAIGSHMAVMFIRHTAAWDKNDSIASVAGSVGIIVTLAIARALKLPISDPMVLGWLTLSFKGVIQLILVPKVYLLGGAGLVLWTILVPNASSVIRIGHLYSSVLKEGWTRARRGLLVGEVANEGSWLVVTVAWLLS